MKEKKQKKEDPKPVLCRCGKAGVLVRFKAKKMISCPDPERCCGNFRTEWKGSEAAAIKEWNAMMGPAGQLNDHDIMNYVR